MIVSTLIGNIAPQERRVATVLHGETFYSFDTELKGVHIPMLVSEYTWDDKFVGKVKITGYLTRIQKNNGRALYLRAVDLAPAEEDDALTNEFVLTGRIKRKRPYEITKNGVEIMQMVILLSLPNSQHNVGVTVVTKDSAARYYRNVEEGSSIDNVYGYLKQRGRTYEIVVKRPLTVTKEE